MGPGVRAASADCSTEGQPETRLLAHGGPVMSQHQSRPALQMADTTAGRQGVEAKSMFHTGL